jgi:hypothetical protein
MYMYVYMCSTDQTQPNGKRTKSEPRADPERTQSEPRADPQQTLEANPDIS